MVLRHRAARDAQAILVPLAVGLVSVRLALRLARKDLADIAETRGRKGRYAGDGPMNEDPELGVAIPLR